MMNLYAIGTLMSSLLQYAVGVKTNSRTKHRFTTDFIGNWENEIILGILLINSREVFEVIFSYSPSPFVNYIDWSDHKP